MLEHRACTIFLESFPMRWHSIIIIIFIKKKKKLPTATHTDNEIFNKKKNKIK